MKRLCGKDVLIKDVNYSELPPFLKTIPIDFTDNLTMTVENPEKYKIPTLEV